MDKITAPSYAKLNLFLEIRGRRKDGYHEIHTVFQAISLADIIHLKPCDQEYSILRCNNAAVPFGKRNLCIKAFEEMRRSAGLERTVEIELEKQIPLGSGLGGGSSNAACVIRGINDLYHLKMTNEALAAVGLNVGSDVPFFIYGGTAIGRGRGEIIRPLPPLPGPQWLVLVKPRLSVSTGSAYQWVRGYKSKHELDEDELESRLKAGDAEFLLDKMYNAFEAIVVKKHPELARYRKELEAAGCRRISMTGSGSSFFGFCDGEEQARAAAAAFADREDLLLAGAYHTV